MLLARRATRGAIWGDTQNHEMFPFVAEYFARRKLRSLGFVSSFDSLSYLKTEIFLAIDQTVEKIQAEEMKKSLKKR